MFATLTSTPSPYRAARYAPPLMVSPERGWPAWESSGEGASVGPKSRVICSRRFLSAGIRLTQLAQILSRQHSRQCEQEAIHELVIHHYKQTVHHIDHQYDRP
jgi:hypothetical protein